MLTSEYLKTFLLYNPLVGDCWWISCATKSNLWNAKYPGKLVGSLFTCSTGMVYMRTRIEGENWLLHRLIWLYMTGEVPERIDHWDNDGVNNRWENLREATGSQNQANAKGPSISIVGGRYRAKITRNHYQRHLGMFDTYEEALAAYNFAANALFGEFAKCNRPEK